MYVLVSEAQTYDIILELMYIGLGVQMIGLFINSSVFVKDYSRKLASVHKLTESGRCMRTSGG